MTTHFSREERKLFVQYMINNNGKPRRESAIEILNDWLFPRFISINESAIISICSQMRKAEGSIKGIYSGSDVSSGVCADYREIWNELTHSNLDVNKYMPTATFLILHNGNVNVAFPITAGRELDSGIIDLELPEKVEWTDFRNNDYISFGKLMYIREIAGVYRVELGNAHSSHDFIKRAKDLANATSGLVVKNCKLGGQYRYITLYASMDLEKCKKVCEHIYYKVKNQTK